MSKRATVVVDLQNEYLPTGKLALSGIEQALANAARVIAATRSNGDPVIHVRHEFMDQMPPSSFQEPTMSGSILPLPRRRASLSS